MTTPAQGREPMLNLTTLLDPAPPAPEDARYGTHRPAGTARPVVAWALTRSCNLACPHCYAASIDHAYPAELSLAACEAFVDDLIALPATALLFTGGEPTRHPHLVDLISRAAAGGLRVTLSTNGMAAADPAVADALAGSGLSYVGVSFDGPRELHDAFRGQVGAFDEALAGVRNLRARGMRVGLRMLLSRHLLPHLEWILDFARAEGFGRICAYHVVPAGRGRQATELIPSDYALRKAVDRLIAFADELRTQAPEVEVLTVANAADGARVLGWLAEQGRDTTEAHRRLARVGGNRAGSAFAHVTGTGDVHPDQFSWGTVAGSVTERPFSEIWRDETGLFGELRSRQARLTGRCADCRYLEVCGGNLRARARVLTGEPWAADPGCYLTDSEIAA